MRKDPTGHEPGAEARLHATLARNLRAARRRKGLTQAKVATAIGVSKHIYWRYERADRCPSIETLREICNVLDVSADTLLGIEPGQLSSAPPLPPDDPPMMRRILGQLRRASCGTRRFVALLLAEVEKCRGSRS